MEASNRYDLVALSLELWVMRFSALQTELSLLLEGCSEAERNLLDGQLTHAWQEFCRTEMLICNRPNLGQAEEHNNQEKQNGNRPVFYHLIEKMPREIVEQLKGRIHALLLERRGGRSAPLGFLQYELMRRLEILDIKLEPSHGALFT